MIDACPNVDWHFETGRKKSRVHQRTLLSGFSVAGMRKDPLYKTGSYVNYMAAGNEPRHDTFERWLTHTLAAC